MSVREFTCRLLAHLADPYGHHRAAERYAAEVIRMHNTLEAARAAYRELLRREVAHSGHGRDGHLNEWDLDVLRYALGITGGDSTDG